MVLPICTFKISESIWDLNEAWNNDSKRNEISMHLLLYLCTYQMKYNIASICTSKHYLN